MTVGASEKAALDGKLYYVLIFVIWSYLAIAVFKSKYSSNPKPKVLYVVVGKRHHIRFFPGSQGADLKGNGNFPSGLVVDDSKYGLRCLCT